MKYLKLFENYIFEYVDYHKLNDDDEYSIVKVTKDKYHDYDYLDGITYELSSTGKDLIVDIDRIEHTEENLFYQDQIERYIEYLKDGGIIETFANGGMVNGKSHAQGGEKFAVGGRVVELEGGEAVINKRSTAMFGSQLSAMNAAGGGVKFADGGLLSLVTKPVLHG